MKKPSATANLPPKSATHGGIVAVGLAALVAGLLFFRSTSIWREQVAWICLSLIAMTAIANFGLDFFVLKVHRRESTGLNFKSDNPSMSRTLVKFLGLLGSVGFVALLYWLFPEYEGTFYNYYWQMIQTIFPAWLCLAGPYIYYVDRYMRKPKDGYWQMGSLLLGQRKEVDVAVIGQHLLGWLVKAFFLPLMFTYFSRDVLQFLQFDFSKIVDFQTFFDFTYSNIFLLDVAIVSAGYVLSLRLLDSHLRSAEPTFMGWVVAVVCYEPFWSLIGKQYINYETGYGWGRWLGGHGLGYSLWGSLILILLGIYVWASVMFGCRFSNLTHRGILTNGPYRWVKHPAYVSKNLAWWLISVPWVADGGFWFCLRKSALLVGINLIYFLRAKTEESHLSRDPAYIEYSEWIAENGLWAKVRAFAVPAGKSERKR